MTGGPPRQDPKIVPMPLIRPAPGSPTPVILSREETTLYLQKILDIVHDLALNGIGEGPRQEVADRCLEAIQETQRRGAR